MLRVGMLKSKRKLIVAAFIICMMFGLMGCSKYPSSFKTVLCVSNNVSDNAFINFSSFEGTKSFKLKCKNEKGGVLKYSAKISEGTATVYYDYADQKEELFTIHAGESIENSLELPEKCTLYVILETNGKCKDGRFDFDIEQ